MRVVITAYVLYLVVALAGLVGWVMNLIDVVHLAFANAPFHALFVARIVGIFVGPLGAVLGYF